MRVKKWLSLLLALALALSLAVIPTHAEVVEIPGVSNNAAGDLSTKTVEFAIREDSRMVKNNVVYVTFIVSVESKDSEPIRAFSFCLTATDLTLATKKSAQTDDPDFYVMPLNVDTMLKASEADDTKPYMTYDYTPSEAKNYFAAGGSNAGAGITAKTDVLKIVGKVTGASPKLSFITEGTNSIVAGDNVNNATTQFRRLANNCTVTYGNATVSGKVLDGKNGGNLAGATVKLMQGTTEKGSATTDAEGNYSFTDVAPGSYTISVTKDDLNGSGTVDVTGVATATAADITAVDFKKGDVNKSGGDPDIMDVEYLFDVVRGVIELGAGDMVLVNVNGIGDVDIMDVEFLFDVVRGVQKFD